MTIPFRSSAAFVVALSFWFQGGDAQYEGCTNGTVTDIGNGRCDAALNVPVCGFDGGDCCPCTCSDGPTYSCSDSDFDCVYPDCSDSTATTPEESTCNEGWLGDGFCDEQNNHVGCSWDGGDCCECSCVSSLYTCGSAGYTCLDPACFDPGLAAEYPDCNGNWLAIGDGWCDSENNNETCGYDGGDCCLCSCSGTACMSTAFDCVDPSAEGEFYECMAAPTAAVPCAAGVKQVWTVETSGEAQALATAMNCSGGSFEVEWIGRVVVDETIYVFDGTVLTINGADTAAVIDGNSATRLFTVIDAALHLNDVNITSGASMTGGAIAAVGSVLTFSRTNFLGNSATGNGGALFVSDGSTVSCMGGGVFANNRADGDGGAMAVTGNSVVSCGGEWIRNAAGDTGGALSVKDNSSVSWMDETTFAFNTAGGFGGALDVFNGSSVSWSGATTFVSNSALVFGGAGMIRFTSTVSWSGATTFSDCSAGTDAGGGGALYVTNASILSWNAPSTFSNNTAAFGGGILSFNSSVSCGGEINTQLENTQVELVRSDVVSIFTNNWALIGGGGIWADDGSSVALNGNTSFRDNSALGRPEFFNAEDGCVSRTGYGGAMAISASRVTTTGSLEYVGNLASCGGAVNGDRAVISYFGETTAANNGASVWGGAFSLLMSNVSWVGTTKFFDNVAMSMGGALHLSSSDAAWAGQTSIVGNAAAEGNGGGLSAVSSTMSWSGMTVFESNEALGEAMFGGALYLLLASFASWSGSTKFVYNSATSGGALAAWNMSSISWTGATEFIANSATTGGALVAVSGSSISWTGPTDFISNTATADGGVVGSFGSGSVSNPLDSLLVMNSSTTFSNNSCGANGGALALLGGLFVSIGAVDVSFINNTAGVAGGAVFVSGTGFGPVFPGVSFVLNSAEVGGAVSTVGSGNLKESADIVPPNPTTFERCHFIDNRAAATGGAIESAAGQDNFLSSVFENNQAGTGGALRLAGTAAIENCSFVDNVSGDEGGAAVSNIGSLLKLEDISFIGNKFDCEPGTFLDYNATGDPVEAACDGCLTVCDGCSFGEPPLVPMCTDAMPHTSSAGGTVTLEMLPIDPGYWRATKSSTDVLPCYHAEACLGGITGAAGYCLEGYEGPYCSICSGGYTSEPGFTCSKCSNSAGGIVLAVVLAVVALVMAAAVTSFLVSGKTRTMRQGLFERLGRYIPLQSVKIVVVAWQILTQFTSVANVTYPDVYQRFLGGLEVFNFDLSWVLSAGCVLDIDFHDRLLMATIGPIIALLFLAVTYLTAARINRGAPDILQTIWNKHVSMVLLLTFVVYSSVSSVLFMAFACEDLDDGKYYLRADYRIECDSAKHRAFQVYAGLMVLVYPVGIPVFYGILLFRDRKVLRHDQSDREETARISSVSDLWKPYKPSAFYYEVVECGRRILLAGVVVFIYPNTAAQIAISLMMAFIFVVVSEGIAPFSSRWDTWLNRIGHAVVYVSMYLALLLKVDVAGERNSSQHVFEALLVAAHACLILVVVGETMILACALRVESRDEPSARFRDGRVIERARNVAPAQGNPFSGDI